MMLWQPEKEPDRNNNKPGCTAMATRKRAMLQQPMPWQPKRKPKRKIEQHHDNAATTPHAVTMLTVGCISGGGGELLGVDAVVWDWSGA